nr:MAG TPA: terminase [Caudoviricetes sp.]
MNTNPFVGIGDDPYNLDSGPILKPEELRARYNSLSDEAKEASFLRLVGYVVRPPTVQQLYTDPYYLGGPDFFDSGTRIFDFWKDSLGTIYPGHLTRYPFLCLSGAIGIGKSVTSRICMMLTHARLCCLRDPYKTFGLAPKPMAYVVYHKDETAAIKEFANFYKEALEKSPFFRDPPRTPNTRVITSGPLAARGLGSDVIFTIMGEVNFWPNPEKAVERVNSMLIRFKSRYTSEVRELVGGFIVDSSAKGASGPTETFLENADPGQTWDCRPAHYEVRPEAYRESKGQTIPVYIGDGRVTPQILSEDRAKTDRSLDKSRIIRCPIQLKPDLKADIYKTLQDVCGISTGSSDLFFGGDISHLVACSKHAPKIPETFYVDFYDKTDRIWPIVEPALAEVPPRTFLSVGLDIAVASDTAGISISAFDHWEVRGKTREPIYRVYACFGLTRKDGQETSLAHIFEFLMELAKRYNISVSFDQAYSKSLSQDLEREGIPVRYLSTDRTPDLSVYLKSVIQYEQIELPEVQRLLREAYDLRVVPPRFKVDHPKKASLVFDNAAGKSPAGSKDLWDSLTQSIYNLHLYLSEGNENGVGTGYVMQSKILTRMTESASDIILGADGVFQEALENIF